MNAERWAHAKAIFHAALDRPQTEREAFVRAAASDDAAVVADVESLLRSHATSSAFLEHPASDLLGFTDIASVGWRIGP